MSYAVFNTKLRDMLVDFQSTFREFVDEKEYATSIDAIDDDNNTPQFMRAFNQYAANKATENMVFMRNEKVLKSCAFFKRYALKKVWKQMKNKDELWSRLCDLYRMASVQTMMTDDMKRKMMAMLPSLGGMKPSDLGDLGADSGKLMEVVSAAMTAPGGTDAIVDMVTSNSGAMVDCIDKMFRKPGDERSAFSEIAERFDIDMKNIGEHADQLKEVIGNPLIANNLRDVMSSLNIGGGGGNLNGFNIDINDIAEKTQAIQRKVEAAEQDSIAREDFAAQALLDLDKATAAVEDFKAPPPQQPR